MSVLGDANVVKKAKKSVDLCDGAVERCGEYDSHMRELLDQLDACQGGIDKLNEEASREIMMLERNFSKIKKPIIVKRSEYIHRIKHFWVTTFVNHPQISAILDDEEEECLNYLSDLQVEEFDDSQSGYRIRFMFDENPYLTNSEISKVFYICDNVARSESSRIEWRDGHNLVSTIKARALHTKSGRKRSIDCKSFFIWFEDNENAMHDDLADVIKDDIWPNPLQYFLVPDVDDDGPINDERDSVDGNIVEINEDGDQADGCGPSSRAGDPERTNSVTNLPVSHET